MSDMLLRVTAPHFCAGIVVRAWRIIDADRILRWSIGLFEDEFRDYARRNHWSVKP